MKIKTLVYDNNRNYTFDALKLLMALLIVLHHAQYMVSTKILFNGYVFVDMFFMISGFFIYRTYNKTNLSTYEFAKSRFFKYFFIYMVGLILTYATKIFLAKKKISIFSFIVELFLVQGLGIFNSNTESINGPCWYLSVLLIGGTMIYYSLKNVKKSYLKILAPTLIILFLGIINGNLDNFNSNGILYIPFIRGLVDMMLGAIISKLVISNEFISCCEKLKYKRLYLYLAEIILLILVFKLCCTDNQYAIVSILIFPLILLIINIDYALINKLLNHRFFKCFSILSFIVYIFHTSFIEVAKYVFKNYFPNTSDTIRLIALFGFLLVFSIWFSWFVAFFRKQIKIRQISTEETKHIHESKF